MEPKLKVFLSSAQFQDEFVAEREGLPIVFEKQPLCSIFTLWRIEDYSSPEDIEEHFIRNVKSSHIVLVLIGKNYRSAVESEFDEAVRNSIPVFAFLKSVDQREQQAERLISKVRGYASTSNYSNLASLVKIIEGSILSHYFVNAQTQPILKWKEQREQRKPSEDNEKSLRILAGILASETASTTKETVVESVLLQIAHSLQVSFSQSSITDKAMSMLSSNEISTRDEIEKGISRLRQKSIILGPDDNLILSEEAGERTRKESNAVEERYRGYITKIYNKAEPVKYELSYDVFEGIVISSVTYVLYESAVDMAEQEFGIDTNPFPYDSDELNRLIMCSLACDSNITNESLALWQIIVLDILMTNDDRVIAWLNRLRKGYWILTVLGMEPRAMEYTCKHFKKYCIYLDSHLVIRAIANAGGDSQLCLTVVSMARDLGIEMRLSHQLFNEVYQAFAIANRAVASASGNVLRALEIYKKLNKRCDILDGYLAHKACKASLTWQEYMQRFFSPFNQEKLSSFLSNELGVSVRPLRDFNDEQIGRIEEITQKLLQRRRQMIHPPNGVSGSALAHWERQHLLRTNEAQQMAIIYELRRESSEQDKQFWFITFDEFVYEVSSSLVIGDDERYESPCYIKPGTWLDILVSAPKQPITINTFREVMLSKSIQQIADNLEAEVISNMLSARLDQDVRSVETLRNMFLDIVNRPAVKDAYDRILDAKGIDRLHAIDVFKDRVIHGLEEEKNLKDRIINEKLKEIEEVKRSRKKAKGKAKYYRSQLSRFISKRSIRKKK